MNSGSFLAHALRMAQMSSRESVGWFGSLLLGLCALPQTVQVIQTGTASGLSWTFLLMWFLGELFTLIYVLPTRRWPLIANYVLNLACLFVMLAVKIQEC